MGALNHLLSYSVKVCISRAFFVCNSKAGVKASNQEVDDVET